MGCFNDPLGAEASPDFSHGGEAQRRPLSPATPEPDRGAGGVAGATEGRWMLGACRWEKQTIFSRSSGRIGCF